MRVSIVVPSYRGAARLPRLLASLAAQDDDRFEAVVVLDGDVDGSADVLAGAPDRVRVVALPENRGRAAALNAGLAAATGDVVARVDDDFDLPPTFVRAQRRLHASADVAVIGTFTNLYPTRSRYAAAYGARAEADLRAAALSCPADGRWRHWGGNVSVRREDVERVGPYDEDFRGYGWEDVDWGYRLHRTGRDIVVSTEVAVLHHAAATTTAVRAVRAYDSGTAQVRFERKHRLVVEDRATAPRTAWQRAVARAARDLTPAEVRRRGEWIDRTLGLLPRALGRKRIALLVEASARAGYVAAQQHRPSEEPVS